MCFDLYCTIANVLRSSKLGVMPCSGAIFDSVISLSSSSGCTGLMHKVTGRLPCNNYFSESLISIAYVLNCDPKLFNTERAT